MPEEKYYLGQISRNEEILNTMFYKSNSKQIIDLMKAMFDEDPIFDFKEVEISKRQFGELEKKSNESLK